MKKIYTLANMAKGMMLAALLAVGTTALAQNVSGNTENGTVEGNENGSNENETFAPAAESSWLQPVKLVGNGVRRLTSTTWLLRLLSPVRLLP